MENIFVLYIIIAVISSLYKKFKEVNEKKPQIPPVTKKTGFEMANEYQKHDDVKDKDKEFTEVNLKINEVYSENTEIVQAKKKEFKKMKSRLVSVTEREPEIDIYDSQSKTEPGITINKDSLIQGIIMAEILRSPRAKRPYRPGYLDFL